jgi:hypothetical protein
MCRRLLGGIIVHGVAPFEKRELARRRRKHLVGGGKDKALVRRFLEEVGKGNLNVIDELLAPDFVD